MIKKIVLYVLFSISILYLGLSVSNNKKIYIEKNINIKGKIVNIKKSNDKTTIDIKKDSKYRITIYENVNYDLGDIISVKGVFKTPPNNTVFNLYNYRKYLLSKKIYLISSNPNIKL